MNLHVRRNTIFATTIAAAFLAVPVASLAQTLNALNSTRAASPQLMAAASEPSVFAAVVQAQPLMAFAEASSSSATLPEAPSSMELRTSAPPADQHALDGNPAPKYAKYISSDESAQPITARDKVVIGLHDLYSPLNFVAMIASAGYEQALNGSPNYGTNSKAFGQRVGAAAIRESSQGLFTDSIFSPILHMDPRYYIQGPDSGFVHRTLYAVTRVFISKTDGGHNTINAPLLLGYAASTALNAAYYPQVNRNFRDSASEYGGSLGGAALGFFVSEFSGQFLKAIHIKK